MGTPSSLLLIITVFDDTVGSSVEGVVDGTSGEAESEESSLQDSKDDFADILSVELLLPAFSVFGSAASIFGDLL